METLLFELVQLNKEILAELRLIRQALNVRPESPAPEASEEEDFLTEPEAPAKPHHPPRYFPQDLGDLHDTLVSGVKDANAAKTKNDAFSEFEKRHEDFREPLARGLKERNKAKSDAFSEFEKRHKDW